MLGTISAFEIKNTSCTIQEIRDMFLDSGLLLRPLGNTVYLLPPYSTTSDMLSRAYEIINMILKKI